MDIKNIVSKIVNAARPDKFEISIVPPAALDLDNDTLNAMVQGAPIPGSQIGVKERMYNGLKVPVPGNRTFEPWSVEFINLEDYAIRTVLERWSHLIVGHGDSEQRSTDIFGSATVTQLGKNNEPLITYTLNNIWPSNISQIEMNHETVDAFQTFSCEFQLTHWERKEVGIV